MVESEDKLQAQPWLDEIRRYTEEYKRWTERGESVIKRYRDERKDTTMSDARFNILWANVRTLKPAIYARPPSPAVNRRFNDQDDIGRCASTILERTLDYEIKHYDDFHATLSHVVDDRLLPGRGVAWLRYEPKIETVEAEPYITNYQEAGDENFDYSEDTVTHESPEENAIAGEDVAPMERIENEQSMVDYVYWQDFAHLPSRTWDEVTWVARRVYMSLEEGEERFGEVFNQVPLTIAPDKRDGEKTSKDSLKKAEVWEIWDKPKKCVYWVAAHYDIILDHREDPLGLENFFPCPRPYYATLTSGSLVPVADFVMYQDQANEIDDITSRIQHLTRALKVMGIYAADEPSIERLMKEGNDAVMVPVTNWQAFIEKGGLQNAIQFIPLRDVAGAISQLYIARDACKAIIYEVTGMSDIMRGASEVGDTATAQNIKAQYGTLRLNDLKEDMARFARDVLRMKAEIMCNKYQPETLLKASGILATPDAQFAMQAIQMLKDEPARNFHIDIETDTLVLIDQQQDKQNRLEFLTAVSGFLDKAVKAGVQSPELIPLMGEMLLFGIRGFKIGADLEYSFEQYIKKASEHHPQPKPPSPEEIKAQADVQAQQASMQLEQLKEQHNQQMEQARLQIEQSRSQTDIHIQEQKNQIEQWKAQLDADTKMAIAQLGLQQQAIASNNY